MFVQSAVLACALAVASAAWNGPLAGGVPASSIPAGISPQACPNYPHCSNPSVAVEPNAPAPAAAQGYYNQPQAQYQPQYQPQQQYQPQPQYQPQSQYNPVPAPQHNQNALDSGEYTGDGDYRGEGLAESGAFGPVDNPQAYNQPSTYQSSPDYQQTPSYQQPAAQVPAGVDPHSCPNYPYCS